MKKNWKLMISLKVVVGRSLVVKQLEILPILVRPIFKLEESIIHPGKNPEKVMNENYSFLSLVRLNYPSRKRREKLRESLKKNLLVFRLHIKLLKRDASKSPKQIKVHSNRDSRTMLSICDRLIRGNLYSSLILVSYKTAT